MAIYNEILSARYARSLSKLFSMKGAAPTKQLAGEISPVLPFFVGAEFRFLEGWRRFAVAPTLAASVGNRNTFRFRNPFGSNVVAVIEKIFVTVSVADTPTLNVQTAVSAAQDADLAAANPSFGLDTRDASVRGTAVAASVCLVSGAAVAPVANGPIGLLPLAAGAGGDLIVTDIQELPVAPATFYELSTVAVNLQLRVAFIWRERHLEESERVVLVTG